VIRRALPMRMVRSCAMVNRGNNYGNERLPLVGRERHWSTLGT
jgi:hypothetical protein